MIQGRTVLIVDELSDTREVLRTVLQSVGLRTVEARRPEQALEMARHHRPDLVVYDIEGLHAAQQQPPVRGEEEDWGSVPMVLLGRATLSDAHSAPRSADRCYLAKPFQYVDLVRTIEELLSEPNPSLPAVVSD